MATDSNGVEIAMEASLKLKEAYPDDIEEQPYSSNADFVALPKRADPFAEREGKTLTWRNVNMTVEKKKNESMNILTNVWGEVPSKQTTAIMGPSGSGKTSLLNILGGRAKSSGRVKVQADVRLNNFIVDPTRLDVRKEIAFVQQDDSLQVAATPRESIMFSAKLRLPRSTTKEELTALTNRMLRELGLEKCADTFVGGSLLKGISGGERKRTSVGVELVVKPSMLFLDEPTSGLDSFSAVQLCEVLKKVSNAGASVLFTIHQPASEIFSNFDHLILLNKGQIMYAGSVSNVPAFFAMHDYPMPPNYNPADWIMMVAQMQSVQELESAGFFPKDERPVTEGFHGDEMEGRDALGNTITRASVNGNVDERHVTQLTEFNWLMRREIVAMKRDKMFLIARFMQATFMSLLIGIIFLFVGERDPNHPIVLQSIFGAIIMSLFMSLMGSALPTLLVFPQERPVFLREYSTDHYSVLAYFVSRFAVEAFITAVQCFLTAILTYYLIGFEVSKRVPTCRFLLNNLRSLVCLFSCVK
jgi:ABC-type multidrug transport system ATPase subunit